MDKNSFCCAVAQLIHRLVYIVRVHMLSVILAERKKWITVGR